MNVLELICKMAFGKGKIDFEVDPQPTGAAECANILEG